MGEADDGHIVAGDRGIGFAGRSDRISGLVGTACRGHSGLFPHPKTPLGLYMADSDHVIPLGGLYMARKRRYRGYARWNSNAHTCDIRESVPYISHLVRYRPRNLPYISEIAPVPCAVQTARTGKREFWTAMTGRPGDHVRNGAYNRTCNGIQQDMQRSMRAGNRAPSQTITDQ